MLDKSFNQYILGYMFRADGSLSLTSIAKFLGQSAAAVSKTGDYFGLVGNESGRGKNSEYSETVFEDLKAIAIFRSLDYRLEDIKELREMEAKILKMAGSFLYQGKKDKNEKSKPPKGLEGFDRVAVIRTLLIADYCPVSTQSIEIDNWEFQKALASGDKEVVELNGLLEKRNQRLKRMLDNSKYALEKIKEREQKAHEAIKIIKSTINLSTF